MSMQPTRRKLLAATASMLTIAGCAGSEPEADNSDGGDGEPTTDQPEDNGETPSPDPTSTATPTGEAQTLGVREHSVLGPILVDQSGMTLYMFESDERGSQMSTCTGGCLGSWPALTVEVSPVAGESVTAELSTFERSGGGQQVAANGWPLYYYASDQEPGDIAGQGVGDVWWVLRPDGTPVTPETTTTTADMSATVAVREHDEYGPILVDGSGRTLYMFDSDERGNSASTCSGNCAENWPPLTVESEPTAGSAVDTALTTFERENGEQQVAANGWPLYYYAPDSESGDATGQGVGDAWWVLDPNGHPQRPETTMSGY